MMCLSVVSAAEEGNVAKSPGILQAYAQKWHMSHDFPQVKKKKDHEIHSSYIKFSFSIFLQELFEC